MVPNAVHLTMLPQAGEQPTMSSLEIAERTGKDHKNVMRDIRAMFIQLDITGLSFERSYRDTTGRSLPCYYLPKRECLILVSGYSVELRAAIIDRWQELEQAQAPRIPTHVEALRLAADAANGLTIDNAGNAYRRLADDEKRYVTRSAVGNVHAGKPMVAVSESGFYKLVLRSDKPEALAFQEWVTREVLPAIRRTSTFKFAGLDLRCVVIDGQPWFSAVDVCRHIGLSDSNASQHTRKLTPEQKGRKPISTLKGIQDALVISESGLYALVMRSDKPQAKAFQTWVTGTVLPAIRKDGMYVQGEEKLDPNNEADLDKLVLPSSCLLPCLQPHSVILGAHLSIRLL